MDGNLCNVQIEAQKRLKKWAYKKFMSSSEVILYLRKKGQRVLRRLQPKRCVSINIAKNQIIAGYGMKRKHLIGNIAIL